MTKEQLKIKSTCVPDRTMDINKWCKEFKVGSRVEKFNIDDVAHTMNQQYDFNKLFTRTEDFGFLGYRKLFKLINP